MRSMRVKRLLAVAMALALSPILATAKEPEAAADANGRKPWNQEQMTDLTGQLSRAMREVRQAYRREPVFRDPTTRTDAPPCVWTRCCATWRGPPPSSPTG